MNAEQLILFSFSITGILLINFFQPQSKYIEKNISEVNKDCQGFVKIKADLIKTFISKKGAKIGVFKDNETILAVLDNFYYPSKNLTVYATASKNGNQCWLFVKKIKVKTK